MAPLRSYWHPLPDAPTEDVPGKLIVLEGTDGVGRSTQIEMLKRWLESLGLAVFDTGLTRSNLAGRDLQSAKDGHTMGAVTQALYYATDFADRLENEMVPALRAGYIVLTDRYIYSLIARAVVRGADPAWMKHVYGLAVIPDLVLYLQADLPTLVPRVLARGGFDYWESGADYIHAESRYDCFIQHQQSLLKVFETMSEQYGFVMVDANRPVRVVFQDLRAHIAQLVEGMTPPDSGLAGLPDEIPAPRPLETERSSRSIADIIADLLGALKDE
jgi:dTMP kinase